MKKALFFLVCLLAGYMVSGQITFERHYSTSGQEGGDSVLQISDGGYIVAGKTGSSPINALVMKTNEYGDVIWSKVYGGALSQIFSKIIKTNDSCYVLCGKTSGLGFGGYNYLLVKINANGDTLWQKGYGSSGSDFASDVIQTSDSGFAIAGYLNSGEAIYLVRTNSFGDTLWTRTFQKDSGCMAESIIQTTDGGYLIGGLVKLGGMLLEDYYVIKTNSFGDTLWTRTYGGDSLNELSSVCKTPDGNYLLSGYTNIGGDYQINLIKINSSGDKIWSKKYGGPYEEEPGDLIATSDNGYAIVGLTTSFGAGGNDIYLIKINQNGDTLWTRTFGGPLEDVGYSIQETSDGGLILSGSTINSWGGASTVYLIKTDGNGHVVGLNENEKANNSITVSPNPFTTSTQITFNQTYQSITAEVYDIEGKLLLQNRYAACDHIELRRGNLSEGLYFLKITLDDKAVETRKIIINN